MKKRFPALLLAAGLAGCGAEPVTHRNYHDIDPADGLFADSATWEWRRKDTIQPAAPVQASAIEQAEFMKWRESAGSPERQEFEEWRAWQEWKRRNPK